MKHIVPSLLAPALAVALPCLVFAQSGTKPSSSAMPENKTASGVTGAEMKTITNEQLDRHLTAKELIGTDVHGSGDKKIGSVVDIVLAPNQGPKSAGAVTSLPSTVDPEVGAVATTPRSGELDRMEKGGYDTLKSAQPPSVVIATGGMMGIGDDLVQIPLSKISYDANRKHVRLNVTESEWKALRDAAKPRGVTSTR